MEFRTTVDITESGYKITHKTPVLFIGSCFASEIGHKAGDGKIPVMINPYGTLFNPFSVSEALLKIAGDYVYSDRDLFPYNDRFYSLSHYSAFSSTGSSELIERLNNVNRLSSLFLRNASYIFVTFGTAWIFEMRDCGKIVANCHKLPAQLFTRRQAEVVDVVNVWMETLDTIHRLNPSVRVWFTISPVRHLNDGVHGNQLSKARLLLAVDALMKHPATAGYFPSYELFMDDLRDYRYYANDMLHPSEAGIQYVWEKFSGAFIDDDTMKLWTEAEKITRATSHRPRGDKSAVVSFSSNMLKKIEILEKLEPAIDFSSEIKYFKSIKE